MKLDEKVSLGRLYERTSQKGFVQEGGEKGPRWPRNAKVHQKWRGARKRPKATSGPGNARKRQLPFNSPLTDIFA